MEAILKYDLPEENVEFELATKGAELAYILWEYDQLLRNKYKYESIESAYEARKWLREIMESADITFDNKIFR